MDRRLLYAAETGDYNLLCELLGKGVDVNVKDKVCEKKVCKRTESLKSHALFLTESMPLLGSNLCISSISLSLYHYI